MSVLCIICARAGSKGVPGKNVALLAGKPCIAYTIEAAQRALAAGAVSRVVVTTDGPEIAEIARGLNAEVIDRPAELAGDAARVDDVARHATLTIERRHGAAIEAVVILYGNVPIRPKGLIERAVGLLSTSGCDSVQSYQPVGKYHPYWMATVDGDGTVRPYADTREQAAGLVLNRGVYRRQDLPPALIPDGAVLCMTREALFERVAGSQPGPHAFFGVDRRGIVNAAGSVVDIDEPIDLLVAEAMLRSDAGGNPAGSALDEPAQTVLPERVTIGATP